MTLVSLKNKKKPTKNKKTLFSFVFIQYTTQNACHQRCKILLPDQVTCINLCPPTEITEFLPNHFKIKSTYIHTKITQICGLGQGTLLSLPVCLFTYVVFHFSVMFVHELKKSHFYLGLIQKSLLVLYYFNGDPFLLHTIIRLYNLKEKKDR